MELILVPKLPLGNALVIKALLCVIVTSLPRWIYKSRGKRGNVGCALRTMTQPDGPSLHWPSRAWRASAFPSGSLGTRDGRRRLYRESPLAGAVREPPLRGISCLGVAPNGHGGLAAPAQARRLCHRLVAKWYHPSLQTPWR
jgi:hypothetical protein